MPERVKKMEGQIENLSSHLNKIFESLSRLESLGINIAKVAQGLSIFYASLKSEESSRATVDEYIF
jgi:hypothetical protein